LQVCGPFRREISADALGAPLESPPPRVRLPGSRSHGQCTKHTSDVTTSRARAIITHAAAPAPPRKFPQVHAAAGGCYPPGRAAAAKRRRRPRRFDYERRCQCGALAAGPGPAPAPAPGSPGPRPPGVALPPPQLAIGTPGPACPPDPPGLENAFLPLARHCRSPGRTRPGPAWLAAGPSPSRPAVSSPSPSLRRRRRPFKFSPGRAGWFMPAPGHGSRNRTFLSAWPARPGRGLISS
jgi:hypothetical protein